MFHWISRWRQLTGFPCFAFTCFKVKARRSRLEPEASKEREEPGPSYDFVKQVSNK